MPLAGISVAPAMGHGCLQVGDLLRSLPEAPETAIRVLGGVFELGALRAAGHKDTAGMPAYVLCTGMQAPSICVSSLNAQFIWTGGRRRVT